MIQRTSSSSHFRYVLLNSIFNALAFAFLCFSGIWRLRGSVWPPWGVAPLSPDVLAGLSCAWDRAARPSAMVIAPASNPTEQRFRQPAENIEGLPHPRLQCLNSMFIGYNKARRSGLPEKDFLC